MGDWLMENGDYSGHVGDFAYDTDNDARCEMGSSDGSTPVWWSRCGYGSSRAAGRRSRTLTPEESTLLQQRNKEQKLLKTYEEELEECSSEEHIKK